jgi:dienelactone hydrolase
MNNVIKINPSFLTLFVLLLSFGTMQAQVQTARTNTSMTSSVKGFYEYLPQGYSATGSTLYPLLIFAHGRDEAGNGGSEIKRVLKHGPPKLIAAGAFPVSFTVDGKTFKFIVLSPQFLSAPSASGINGVIDYALNHYKVDPKRIYLTGLSAGGGAIEEAAANATISKRIAAIVEFAGASTPTTTKGANIASNKVAFLGFHNMYDGLVSSSKTINYVNYILAADPTAIAIKKISGTGGGASHDCWTSRYPATFKMDGVRNIYEWMLQYSRGSVSSTNKVPVANAGSDKTITLPTSSITLSGSATDADGTISKYSWTKVAGPSTYVFSSTTVATPTVSGLLAGTYTFRLTATDNSGATDYDDVNVIVNPALTTTYTVPGKVEAENYSTMSGVEKQTTTDAGGGQNVGYLDQGDWMSYSIKTTSAGTYSVTFRVASAETGAQCQVKNSSGTVLATITVPNTGAWQVWKDVTASVSLVSGTQTLKLYSANAAGWNINYMYFASGSATSSEPSATKIEAENYSAMSGVEKQTTTDAGGGQNISYIDKGDWMTYNVNVAKAGAYTFTFRVASTSTGGQFKLLNASGTALTTVTVPNTGGWQAWRNVTATVTLPAGSQVLKISSTATPHWNLNYFTFSLSSGTTSASALASNMERAEETAAQAPAISITPNPFADKFVLTVNNDLTGVLKVQLIDVNGTVRKEFQLLKNGTGTMQSYLSAGTLPAGTYFIKVQMGTWSQSKQAVKL